jgi:phosphate transport system protein
MPRETFDRELQRLQDELLVLGSMVEEAIIESVNILRRRDLEAARQLVAHDSVINEKRFAIEGDALTIIATQQPMAGDLRTIAAVLEVATELERIGDYAKGIARICVMMGVQPLVKPLVDVPLMAVLVRDMLHDALEAFVRRDARMARAIPARDEEVDALYDRVYRELLDVIVADQRTIDGATHLLWVAHNLERTGDRVTNICERVVFTVTGEMIEMDVDDLEDAARSE